MVPCLTKFTTRVGHTVVLMQIAEMLVRFLVWSRKGSVRYT